MTSLAAFAAIVDTAESPWWVVEGDDKRGARINMISHLLSTIPYVEVQRAPVELPQRPGATTYVRPPRELFRTVPDVAGEVSRHPDRF